MCRKKLQPPSQAACRIFSLVAPAMPVNEALIIGAKPAISRASRVAQS
jgi:hypothetical protein